MGDIVIDKISLKYGSYTVFDELSETIHDGECYVIFGASGSGKSSLLKVIAGLFPFITGKVLVDGDDIFSYDKQEMLAFHTRSGFVFEKSALISNLSIYDNLALIYRYHDLGLDEDEIKSTILYHLNRIGMTDNVNLRPDSLSLGERMMVGIVRAISHEPDYIFWDEPMANLDRMTAQKVIEIVLEMKEKKKTMVIVTHNLEFAKKAADRIGILSEGKIVESGTFEELQHSSLPITGRLLNIEANGGK